MKTKPPQVMRGYLAALRRHLTPGSVMNTDAAHALGVRAVKMGLETLDLANTHEAARISLNLSLRETGDGEERMRRASSFFTEAITPLEETNRSMREANAQLKVTIKALSQRTQELAHSYEKLQNEISRREEVEKSLVASELTSSELLLKSRQMHEDLRLLSRQILSAQEEERKRISRELHDIVAQTLTGINVRLATLTTQTTANARDFHKKITLTQRMVSKSVDIVHRFARDLRPSVLDDLGLIPALHAYMKEYMTRTGIRVVLTATAEVEKLNIDGRTSLYRIVQESLSNTSRHAHASKVTVVITHGSGEICMEIRDNGRGFLVDEVAKGRNTQRLGLLGMRERVDMVGGTFFVESTPGKETLIRVQIPFRKTTSKK